MSLRIEKPRFFLDTYRTRKRDTKTNKDQAECESAVENCFQQFLKQPVLFPK